MMKIFSLLLFCCLLQFANAQNPIPIPTILSGSSIQLSIHSDSVQFLNGRKTFTNAFNNFSYLGPTLVLNKGEFVSLDVNNQLNDTTTVHWHGLHVPSVADGGPHTVILPNSNWLAQFEVKNNAAMYWYHPHLHMRTGEQAMRGAAGVIIVRDSFEATLNLPRSYGIDDFPLIVQTQQFDSANQILWRGMNDSIILINGTTNPQLNLPAQVVRLRLLNAAQGRSFNFGFSGNLSFSIIASDGGLLQAPVNATRLQLSPGERAEILINLQSLIGQRIYLMSYASEFAMGVQGAALMTGMDSTMESPLNGIDFNLLQIDVTPPLPPGIFSIPSSLANFTPLIESQSEETRWITITPQSSTSFSGPFFFNGQSFDMMRIDYTIPLDHTEIWTISNQSMVAHPFHIHDVQFFILDRNGTPPPLHEQGFKDDVLILPNESIRLIMKFEDYADPIIPYMYHCHILMHEDDGMMGQFIVSSSSGVSDNQSNEYYSIFPNPVETGILHVRLPKENSGECYKLEILNVLGTVIHTESKKLTDPEFNLNLSSLATGSYFLKMEFPDRVFTQKFIKTK